MPDTAHSREREKMACEQNQLLEALLAGTKPPEGFVESDIAAAREVLLRKRIRTMQRAIPEIENLIANVKNRAILNKYLKTKPSCHPDGPYQDGKAFLFYLKIEKWLGRARL